MSFSVPEILQIDEDQIDAFLQKKSELQLYEKTLDEIMRQRAHVLSESEEIILSEASEALSAPRSEEHTSELQSRGHLVCRLLLEKKKTYTYAPTRIELKQPV